MLFLNETDAFVGTDQTITMEEIKEACAGM